MDTNPSPQSEQRCGSCKETKPLDCYSPSYRGKPGTWCKTCFAAYNKDRKSRPAKAHDPIQCSFCGTAFVPKQDKSEAVRFCSWECKEENRNRKRNSALAESKPDRRCVWCGVDMPKTMRADAKFCSERCNSHAHQSVKRFRRRLNDDDPKKRGKVALPSFIDMAERDKWICGICRKPVDPKLYWPDPMAGSIDHLIPVSRGGGHEMSNLQLSHFVCNWSKRDRPADDRLRLL